MPKYYLTLQLKRFQRYCGTLGINPYILLLIGVIVFSIVAFMLKVKTAYADLILFSIGVFYIWNQITQFREDMYLLNLSTSTKTKLKIFIGLLISIPFDVALLFYQSPKLALLLTLLVLPIAFFPAKQIKVLNIPTPFKSRPFEYIIGFRKTYWLILLSMFILFQAIHVDNFNLALFSLGLPILMSLSYILKPEPVQFVWINKRSAKAFLMQKITESCINLTILIIPFALLLGACYYWNLHWIILTIIFGYILNALIIIAKYSAFPKDIGIPQGLLFALCFSFPPLILIVLPIFYNKAINNLNNILV